MKRDNILKRKKIVVITPCFNEEANIRECYKRLKDVFNSELDSYDYEHIFCDNSSADNTVQILRDIAENDKNVKLILNSRNFGAFNSMFNGMMAANGDAIIPFLPADLQDPPELIPEFVKNWESGFEVVYGVRAHREESVILHNIRKFYYQIINKFASINIPLNVGEFTLIDKKVQSALKEFQDYYPYVRGMIASCGFKSTSVSYTWKARKAGISKANLYVMIDNGLNGLISFTNLPMRLCMLTGFLISFISILYSFFTIASTLFFYKGVPHSGIPTLTVALFFFAGVNLFFLGVLGEYISAIHFQVRKRPLVIERERINFD
jgi:glycosyltransferase involved in cell wall biosynthesis